SADSKSVTLSGYYLAGGGTITVVVTHEVKDLAGNALADFTSRFSVVPRDTASPTVITQRPVSGATGVPAGSPFTLGLEKPLDPVKAAAAFHVTQNGMLFPGTSVLVENGQAIRFTPANAFQPGGLIQ